MIHRDRGGNCVERRLLALMIAVALFGAVLPGLIGRRGTGGIGASDGGNGSLESYGIGVTNRTDVTDSTGMTDSSGMTDGSGSASDNASSTTDDPNAGGVSDSTSADGSIASNGDTASAVSSEPGESGADSTAVPTKACAALPMGTRAEDGVPLLGGTVRALWIASAYAIDYPSGDGSCIAELRAEINRIVKNASDMGMNAIFFQVRPAADALYRSEIFPVSSVLGGELPYGFDPLAELCAAAHRRGISVAAWVNPLRVTLKAFQTREQALASLPASSPAAQHPEYCAFPGGRLWLDPGYPEVRELVAAGVAEIVRDYPVDGVLFDDYFYPYPSASDGWDDSESYALYGGVAEIGDFRRANISELIRLCSEAVHGARDGDAPPCVFGVSPFGIWRNSSLDPRGSDTRGFSAYDGIYADALEWVRSRTVDFLSPQIYFRRDDPAAPALTLMQWWSDALGGSGIPLVFSLADYKAAQWEDGGEVAEQELLARDIPGCIGCAHYGYGALCADDYGVRSCLSASVMSE